MALQTMSEQDVSAFCENLCMLLSAGISAEEALGLMGEDDDEAYAIAVREAAAMLREGKPLADALSTTRVFPVYMVHMVGVGENTGRLENTLQILTQYYDRQAALKAKLKSAVTSPAVLLGLMALVLAVLIGQVLPVFTGVYQGLAGDLITSSFSYVGVANAVSWIALVLVVVMAACLLVALLLLRTESGKLFFARMSEHLGLTRAASLRMAQAQFTEALSAYIASGVDTDTALEQTIQIVAHKELHKRLSVCMQEMKEGSSLAQAVYHTRVYEPRYARMLQNGAHSGNYEQALQKLAAVLMQDADTRLNRLIDSVEPMLAAFLSVSVGLALLSVMLPLVGILNSIG